MRLVLVNEVGGELIFRCWGMVGLVSDVWAMSRARNGHACVRQNTVDVFQLTDLNGSVLEMRDFPSEVLCGYILGPDVVFGGEVVV